MERKFRGGEIPHSPFPYKIYNELFIRFDTYLTVNYYDSYSGVLLTLSEHEDFKLPSEVIPMLGRVKKKKKIISGDNYSAHLFQIAKYRLPWKQRTSLSTLDLGIVEKEPLFLNSLKKLAHHSL